MLEIKNKQNQASLALIKENTREKLHFRMSTFVLSKWATPMNQHLERVLHGKIWVRLRCEHCSFQDRSTQPDMGRYLF